MLRYVLTRSTLALVLSSLLLLLTASAASAHGRPVAVAKAPVKVNNTTRGIKFSGYYYLRNAVRHHRVRVIVCLQVQESDRGWSSISGACARDTDRRDWWVNAGGRGPCFLGIERYRTVAVGWAKTRSGERKHVRRDTSRARTISCQA